MPSSNYPTRALGKNGPQVSAIGFGAMSIGHIYGQGNENDSLKTLTHAADRGISHWDTSNVYGPSEEIIGKWFAQTGRREEIFLATKFGGFGSSKPSEIKEAIKTSLKNLQTDRMDLYYQHRPDPQVPIEVVFETLKPYVESGVIKYLGVSEVTLSDIKRVKALGGILAERLIVTQSEFSPWELEIEKSGFLSGVLDLGLGVVAYSPLGRGFATGRFKSPADFSEGDFRRYLPRYTEENFPKNLAVADKIKAIAEKTGFTLAQVTLAWILAEYPSFLPIPGCKDAERLEENVKGAEIQLSPEDVKAIREVAEAADVAGARYGPGAVEHIQNDSLPLDQWKGE